MKNDADQIRDVLDDLSKMDWIRWSERQNWPRFLFHYTDVQNAAHILSSGFLYSRRHLEDSIGMPVSSGSYEVLAGTQPWIKNYVRLYFRPKTPTQYYAEGVKSSLTLSNSSFPDAHCPVPVFFLFDSAEILSRGDCLFSDKGLGSRDHKIMSTAQNLANLEWQKIYHTGPFDSSSPEEEDITSRRMAEVIIPNRLNLTSLKWIYCRSEAEKDTLLYLLSEDEKHQYARRIVTTPRSGLFFRQHTYLKAVRKNSHAAYLSYSPDTQSRGPFQLRAIVRSGDDIRQGTRDDFVLKKGKFRRTIKVRLDDYELEIRLDEHLIYRNRHIEGDDIPV